MTDEKLEMLKIIDAIKMLILRYTDRLDMPAEETDKMDIYEEIRKILFQDVETK